jgi:hypothetical protein
MEAATPPWTVRPDSDIILLQTVGNYLPADTASYPRIRKSSYTTLARPNDHKLSQ